MHEIVPYLIFYLSTTLIFIAIFLVMELTQNILNMDNIYCILEPISTYGVQI